jgi:uncharacterized protein YjbJ (UPF0337 family)
VEESDKLTVDNNQKERTMKNDKLSGNWHQIVGQVKNQWGKLTDQELEQAKGNMDKLVGLIQQKYGETKETVEHKINKMLDRF